MHHDPRRCIIFRVTPESLQLNTAGLAVQLDAMVTAELALEAAEG